MSGEYQAGAIYSADGSPQTPLLVVDAARAFNNGLIKGLTDSGLVPVALDSNPADGKPPEGSDFILSSELEQFEVNKRFEANQTIHGQYFTMNAVVRAKFELKNRDGAVIYSGEISWPRERAAESGRRRGLSPARDGTRRILVGRDVARSRPADARPEIPRRAADARHRSDSHRLATPQSRLH